MGLVSAIGSAVSHRVPSRAYVSPSQASSPLDQWLCDHGLLGQSLRQLCDVLAGDARARDTYVHAVGEEIAYAGQTPGALTDSFVMGYAARVGMGDYIGKDTVFQCMGSTYLAKGHLSTVVGCKEESSLYNKFVVKEWNPQRNSLEARLSELGAWIYLNSGDVFANPLGPTPWLVMPKLEGITLRELIQSEATLSSLPCDWKHDLMLKLLTKLESLHARGAVHSDLKPMNIMVTPNGAMKFFDYGNMSTPLFPGQFFSDPLQLRGSLHYMAPEQVVQGHVPAPSDDLFAAAVTYFELLTESKVFRVKNTQGPDGVQAVLAWNESDLSRVLATVTMSNSDKAFLAKALHPDLAQRYQTAADMREALLTSRKTSTIGEQDYQTWFDFYTKPDAFSTRSVLAHLE